MEIKNNKVRKVDARVIRSKRDLANALEELLTQKQFDDITIKEICEKAMVSKLTFYNNFLDKTTLLMFLFHRYADEINFQARAYVNLNQNLSDDEIYEGILNLTVSYFYNNKERFRKMVMNNNSYAIYYSLTSFSRELYPEIQKSYEKFTRLKNIPHEVCLYYYTGAFTSILYNLLRTNKVYSKDEIIKYMLKLTHG